MKSNWRKDIEQTVQAITKCASLMKVTSFTHSSHGTVPSEMLESWNIVSKAWWISANEGRSNGLHCQPGSEKGSSNLFSFTIKHYYKPAMT